MNQLFEISLLRWDTLLSLDAGGSGLILPQMNVPGFIDFPWEALYFGRSRWKVGCGRVGGQKEWDDPL